VAYVTPGHQRRSGRDHQLTIRRFLEQVSEDEMASLRRAVFSADWATS
jgi:hypothetical protein